MMRTVALAAGLAVAAALPHLPAAFRLHPAAPAAPSAAPAAVSLAATQVVKSTLNAMVCETFQRRISNGARYISDALQILEMKFLL